MPTVRLLPWSEEFPPFLVVADDLELPMDTAGCAPCRLVIEHIR
jgi:hypothetical protein